MTAEVEASASCACESSPPEFGGNLPDRECPLHGEASAPLFHSPLGLFDFQVDAVARTYWQWTETDEQVSLMLYDTGIGKSVIAMALAAMAQEDGLVDQVIVVAEANKCLDWVEDDFPRFTQMGVANYSGGRRQKILADPPQVLVMSYETGRNDIVKFKPRSRAIAETGVLAEYLRGKRTLIVFDEFSRLRKRSNKTYIAWEYLVNRVLRRDGPKPYVLGLTATTVESNPEDHWNAGRILSPSRAGPVADFGPRYVRTYDLYEKPKEWKNLTHEDCEPGVLPLNQMFGPITQRKRKTDDDVIDYFPRKMENSPTMVTLGSDHQALYDQVEEIFAQEDLDDNVSRQGFGLLRMIANHPMSLIGSEGAYAQDIVANVGGAYLERLGSAKLDATLEWQWSMATQQTVIFTFYGQSVLPRIEHALRSHGYSVSINHGGLSQVERKRQQDAYKAGDTQVFLSSDAGAKGLNLGVGSGLLHYENPMLWSTFDQRSNRIHRIDSRHPSVTIDQLVAQNTLEIAITRKMLKRNQWAEAVQDADYIEDYEPSERFLRAADRLALLRRARG